MVARIAFRIRFCLAGMLVALEFIASALGQGPDVRARSPAPASQSSQRGLSPRQATTRQPSPAPSKSKTEFAAERYQLWQKAQQFASAKKWPEAANTADDALQLQVQHFGERALDTCAMLEILCYWRTRERNFPLALAAAKELSERRTLIFGADHWQSVDARQNVGLMEKLSRLDDQQWSQFESADTQHAEAISMKAAGDIAGAIKKLDRALPVYVALLGPDEPLSLACLRHAAICHVELSQFDAAQKHVSEVIERQFRIKGLLHPETVITLHLLGRFNELVGSLDHAEDAYRKRVEVLSLMAGPDHIDTTTAWVDVGRVLSEREKLTEAEEILVKALEQQRAQLGDENVATAQTMKVLGVNFTRRDKLAEAEPLLTDCITIFEKQIGKHQLATAGAYSARGRYWIEADNQKRAAADLEQAMQICQATVGEMHPATGKVCEDTAELYERWREHGVARQYRIRALQIAQEHYGELNVLTADALEYLGRAYLGLNDYAMAETYFGRARAIRVALLGNEHPKTARVVNQLGYVYLVAGDPARAEPLLLEALKHTEKDPGTASRSAARIRARLGQLYQIVGDFEQAEHYYRQGLKLVKNDSAATNFYMQELKVGLAQTLLIRGQPQEACRLVDEVEAVYESTIGENDFNWVDVLSVAGISHLALNDTNRAEQYLARALRLSRLRMDSSGAFESERQRMSQAIIFRHAFDQYLSVPPQPNADLAAIYPHVLSWKGAVASRQWRDRQVVTADTASMTAELQQVTRRIATLKLRVPEPDERVGWGRRIFDLTMRKEALDEQRAVHASAVQKAVHSTVTVDAIQKILPASTALIDIMHYTHTSFESRNGRLEMVDTPRLVAFIVRPGRQVVRIDLGDAAPIHEAVNKWQQTRGFRPNKGKIDWAQETARLVWEPMRSAVEDCSTILVSPDGPIARLAWCALPGPEPDSFLIEKHAFAIVPVPQLLPEMLAAKPTPAGGMNSADASLLLVGDIDFDAPAEDKPQILTASNETRESMNFKPLRGTKEEVHALRDQFRKQFPTGNVELLDQGRATEENFWREAPQHRWLHLATHGFFAPSNITSAISALNKLDLDATENKRLTLFHANYLNGLALAGANAGAVGEGDDGILTAAELLTMDLHHVELAVLSGCETGLGAEHGGEGSFGMQRALQIAGVGSIVGSLWPVSDQKTNLLMQRFYSNLWERGLPKLEALREAQIWLLNGGPDSGTANAKRLSPHYWAAFNLSGDWR